MTTTSPVVGIDLGNTRSSIGWFDPRTRVARVVLNSDGDSRTPSIVHYGDDSNQVGRIAEQLLQDDKERARVLLGVKRDLAKPIRYSLGARELRPVDVVADILRQLKMDVERAQARAPVVRAVLAHPAEMDQLECDLLEQAAQSAGFTEVALLPEPVAAAIACVEADFDLGERVLIYDFGGSTCSVSLLGRASDTGYDLVAEPRLLRCGGDDLDRALYDHFEEHTRQILGRSIGSEERRDLGFLFECRHCKERLSFEGQVELGFRWSDGVQFTRAIDRETFDGLVAATLEPTIRLATQLLTDGGDAAKPNSVVMIGGTSWIPHLRQLITDALGVAPIVGDNVEHAVALGAAAYAGLRWVPVSDSHRTAPTQTTDAGTDLLAQVEAALGITSSTVPGIGEANGHRDVTSGSTPGDSESDDRLLRQVNAALGLGNST